MASLWLLAARSSFRQLDPATEDALMRSILILLFLAAAGCPSPPNPVPVDIPGVVADMARAPLYPNCAIVAGKLPGIADVCDGMVTKDNRACVRCPANQGCFDRVDAMYCIVGSDCTKDKACHADTGGASSAAKPQPRVR